MKKESRIVSVKTWDGARLEAVHFLQSESGHGPAWVTQLLFAVGGIFLAMFVGMGLSALRAVSSQEALRRVWLDIAKTRGLPEKLVPPVQGEPMLEIAALAALLIGGILVGAALSRRARQAAQRRQFTIGDDPASSWVCSARRLPSSRFELVKLDESGSVRVNVCDWMRASIRMDGRPLALTDLAHAAVSPGVRAWMLDAFDEIRVEHENFSWVITPGESVHDTFPLRLRPGLFTGTLAVTLGVFAAMLLMFERVHADPFFGDGVEAAEVQLRQLVRMPDRVAEKRRELETVRRKDEAEKLPVYKPEAVRTDETRASGPRDPRVAKNTGEASPVRVSGPQGAGVANVLASSVQAMTASLTANNTVFGQETENLSDLLGDFEPAAGGEDPGFGPRGSPGPGSSGGPLGIGGPPQIGWGRLPGGDRLGPPSLDPIKGPPRREIGMREGTPHVSGRMDPNEVRAVIRAHRNEVHHCYQKGLLENDRLSGVVRVTFLLSTSGRASECRVEESLARASVGDCICARILNWRFPQPEGGLAKISYSWTLQPGGN